MKNVTLIGASGFVGTAILNELLSRGHKVTAVVRNPEKINVSNSNLRIVKADVSDTGARRSRKRQGMRLSAHTIRAGQILISTRKLCVIIR